MGLSPLFSILFMAIAVVAMQVNVHYLTKRVRVLETTQLEVLEVTRDLIEGLKKE